MVGVEKERLGLEAEGPPNIRDCDLNSKVSMRVLYLH